MSEGHDLSGKRVSNDDAFIDVTRLRSQLEKSKKELRAVKKDRDDLLTEYEDLYAAKYPAPPENPHSHQKKDFTRVIACDLHGMVMDVQAVNSFISDLDVWQPSEIVLNGDIVTCDGWLAKHHTLGYVAQTNYSYQDDIAAANWFLDKIQDKCPNAVIYLIEGNHDERIEKWIVDQTQSHTRDSEFLKRLCSPEVLLRLKDRGIKFFSRSEVHAKNLPPGWIKLGKIFFTHELGSSKHAAANAVAQTAGNVVYAHTHRADSSTLVLPGVGLVTAWNPGCLCERQPLWRHSNPTNWSHGYGVQVIAKSGNFMHQNIPIWEGQSLAQHLT